MPERGGEINLFRLGDRLFQEDWGACLELIDEADNLRAHRHGGDQQALAGVGPRAVRGAPRHVDAQQAATLLWLFVGYIGADSAGGRTHRDSFRYGVGD